MSICFHQFPNPFVLFITFKSDKGVGYNGVIFQIALNALGNIVCKSVGQNPTGTKPH